MTEDIDELFETVESEESTSREVSAALAKLERIADAGDLDVAEGIAEAFAFSEAHHDFAKAYFWYQVSLGSRGYTTTFENLHDRLEDYCGRDGDFRNEGQVNHLVGELGEFRVRQLDAQASAWLKKHSGG
jgi:hypothetical protein